MDYLIEHDYEADEVDELTIRKGDIINSVRAHEDGWMIGILRGKEGVFPSNFGKPLKEERRKSQDLSNKDEETIPENIKHVEDDVPVEQERPAKKVTGVGFGNIFSGGKIQLKQTNNHKDVKSKPQSEETKPEQPLEKKPIKPKVEYAKVLHDYTAENIDELTLEEGEIITILDKENEDEGWWKGKLQNGQIGVFPDNFVELVKTGPEETSKPVRPTSSAAQKGPPPILAAKPNAKAVPPRPPQILDMKNVPSKPISRITSIQKEEGVSFEAPLNHKPLVGPNAGRAKRPGKKLPTNINVVPTSNNDEEKTILTPKSNSSYKEKNSDFPISKQKSKDNINSEPSSEISHSKPKTNESIEKVPEKIPDVFTAKTKTKDVTPIESTPEKGSDVLSKHKSKENIVSVDKGLEQAEPKSFAKSKPSFNTDSSLRNTGTLKEEINTLCLKVSNLQDENLELKQEISELRKSSTDQINQLKSKLSKLSNEFDQEKAKWAATDLTITLLKEAVEDLEVTMLSRSQK